MNELKAKVVEIVICVGGYTTSLVGTVIFVPVDTKSGCKARLAASVGAGKSCGSAWVEYVQMPVRDIIPGLVCRELRV